MTDVMVSSTYLNRQIEKIGMLKKKIQDEQAYRRAVERKLDCCFSVLEFYVKNAHGEFRERAVEVLNKCRY